MNLEKLFRDYDVEPFTRIIGNELKSTKLTIVGYVTKIKNLGTKEVRYILHQIKSIKKTES